MPPPPGYQADDPVVANDPTADLDDPETTFLADGRYVVVWTDFPGGSQTPGDVRAQLFDRSGAKIGDDFLVHDAAASDQRGGRVAPLSSGGFIVTWTDNGMRQVFAQVFDEAGQKVGAEIQVSTTGYPSGTPDIVTLMSGNVAIVWHEFEEPNGGWEGSGIRWAEYEPSGALAASGTVVGYRGEVPHLAALDDGGFVVSYTLERNRFQDYPEGVSYQVFGPNAGPARSTQVSVMPEEQHSIANLETGGFVIVWAARVGYSPERNIVYAQLCAPDGTRIGGRFQVSDEGNYSGTPDVVLVPGLGFAVTWYDSDHSDTIRIQLFSNEGVRIGDEFTVEDGRPGGQVAPQITADGFGSLLIAWRDVQLNPDGSVAARDIVARLFDLPSAAATPGDDVLAGTAGADTIRGGTGDDSYLVNHDGDRPLERPGEGIDTVYSSISYALAGNTNIERLETSDAAGTDPLQLTGNLVYNRIVGNAGANRIDGGLGKDELIGLGGNDTYLVDNAGDTIIEAAGGGVDRIFTSASYVLADGQEVEALVTSDWAATVAIALTGNDLDNQLIGNAGRNRLDGGGGRDTMIGREGDDVYIVDRLSDVVIEYAGQGADIIYAPFSYSLGDSQEVESLSARHWEATDAIDLTGNGLNNQLIGNAGRNRLDGKSGADTMFGREGDDTYFVDNAGDRPTEYGGQGSDIVYTSVSFTLAATTDVESLSTISWDSVDALNLTGNGLANTLIGNDGVNQLDGKSGADVMIGRGGNDKYLVDNAGDKVFEAAGGGSDVVFTSVSVALTNDQEIEGLSTITWQLTDAIDLTGNGLNNNLIGNAGVNVLDGKGGNDTLQGREGADIYAFTTALGANNVDLILGFSAADDTIRLENNGVFTGLANGALPASAFVVGTAAQDGNDRIVYNQATGQLFFDAGGNGAGAAIHFATLQGAPVITANDFTVI